MAPPANLDRLLAQDAFPGQTSVESGVIHDWLIARGAEFDEIQFSVRMGEPRPSEPNVLPGVFRMWQTVTRHRLDILARRAGVTYLVEAKARVTSSVIGQLRMYRRLYLEEDPTRDEPILLAIGRTAHPEALRICNQEGIAVLLYETA